LGGSGTRAVHMPEVELSAGPIEYVDTGGDGPVLVLLHGLVMDGTIFDAVVQDLRVDHRCIVPTLPLGSHRRPMRPEADLSFRGHVELIAEFLERLDLCDVTLVQSDMGFAQLLAAEHPERLGRLVLLSCEAFDNYPPGPRSSSGPRRTGLCRPSTAGGWPRSCRRGA